MRDKGKKDHETEDIVDTTSEVETDIDEEDETALLKEINITLAKDIDFYKEQLTLCHEKLKKAEEILKGAAAAEQKLKEMQLDYDNLKKRSAEKIETAEEEGIIKATKMILPTIDNFRRAIVSIADQSIVGGLKMIYKQLMEALAELDVEEIPALGLQFDPEIHNAVMQIEDDEKESGSVVEVLQKGYIKGDKVIRYSQVKIAR